ncbi:hypothetical protein OG394_29795 [Kribbella sp. NBC_01245]|uniref:hypothetical protein n=1 Tax=Kribbella sp. NBC_01245 TaxID=2903578 RepID=UPI002E28780A|nr:hypothetical protein [Kribbella sp. NBC_01245]
MSGQDLLLLVVCIGLVLRAIWATAVLHRHSGWVAAGGFIGALAGAHFVDADWPLLIGIVTFVVAEFFYQTAGNPHRPQRRPPTDP